MPSNRTKCKKGVLVFIELKKCRSRKLDGEFKALGSDGITVYPEQLDFIKKMNEVPGIVGEVCYGADETITYIKSLLK